MQRRVRFLLVEPLSAGNVGAAARALKNLGFRDLGVVAPACDPRGKEARAMAVDAADLLDELEVFEHLDAALEGARAVVGTSRRTGKQRRPHFRLDEFATDLARLASAGELAILFGRETHGLTDAELDRCTHLVRFLASEEYPSFNLAQSVLVVAYELRRALASDSGGAEAPEPAADHAAREAMYGHLEEALLAAGHLHEDTAEGQMRRIRRILGRANLTEGDTKVFRGIARQILWLSRSARLEPPDPCDTPKS